jgi:hypothetical protein
MKPLFGFVCAALLCSVAFAFAQNDQNEIRCLKSVGLKNPIRLQFEFPGPNQLGYVIYEHGSERITVKQLDMKETQKVPDRPSFYTLKFAEVSPNNSGGVYTLVIQGAMVEDAEYKCKDGKVFHFEDDTEAMGERVCMWKK